MAGIYIHIPFCRQKCHYCNFFSMASIRYKDAFILSLLQEMSLRREYLGDDLVETIYFGGGTPSLLTPGEMETILNKVRKNFSIGNNPEITLEVNPEDVSSQSVSQFLSLGFNRISLGVQSFYDDDLAYLHRNHDGKQALRSLDVFLDQGVSNLSIDLIYGIPTLSLDKWENNLKMVQEKGIPHLSAYWLTIEEGTALEIMLKRKKYQVPEEEEGIQHFHSLRRWADGHSYIPYEISNFAKPGFFSKHNHSYWEEKKYLGLGPSAHSYDGQSRQWNLSSVSGYIREIKQGNLPCHVEMLTPEIRYQERIMTGLRTLRGVNMEKLSNDFGEEVAAYCFSQAQQYLDTGQLMLQGKNLILSEEGILLSDSIIADLFLE